MSDFLQKSERNRAIKIMNKNPKVGEFVNLVRWYDDIWSEILYVSGSIGSDVRTKILITICRKDDDKLITDSCFPYQIRNILNKQDLIESGKLSIVYAKDFQYNDFPKKEYKNYINKPTKDFA